MTLRGLTWDSLKKNPSLLPLFFFVGCAVTAATIYTGRLALKNPEITFNRSGNPEPWNEYSNKNYKFFNPSLDPNDSHSKAPKY